MASAGRGGSTSTAAPEASHHRASSGPASSTGSSAPGSSAPGPSTGTHAPPFVHVPSSLPPGKVPLVIALHGSGSSPVGAETTTGFNDLADRYGFIVAYLGSGSPGANWKSPADTTYVGSEITSFERTYPIDPQRVYITGFSAGGYEAYRAGCLLSRQVAAVAPVGVTMNQVLYRTCQPRRPVSTLIIIGTADPHYGGGSGPLPSAPAAAALWRTIDGCPSQNAQQTIAGGPTVQQVWSGCVDGSRVGLYQIQGGYHIWPSPGLHNGTPDSRYDGATAAWQFFSGLRGGSLTRPDVRRVAVAASGLSASGGQTRAARRVTATITSSEPLAVTVTLSAGGRTLARATRRASAGTLTLRLAVPGSAHASRYRLRILVSDRYGRSETVTRTVAAG